MRFLSCFIMLVNLEVVAQFAPPAGQTGTSAIPKDSSAFIAWATGCRISRGYQDISNTGLGYATIGDSSMALGAADGVVSLGDGGVAILTFDKPIVNGPGWDFAVFENSFSDTYLELAFTEVSSDGVHFFRFPAASNTQDSIQVGGFGDIDATKINNLAGKYRASFGTPFDLEELKNEAGLNVHAITHVRIIDVVGCIQNNYATFDKNGHKINDPWKTAFASGGFDLDAIGVINQGKITAIPDHSTPFSGFSVYPHPINSKSILRYYLETSSDVQITMTDLSGREVFTMETVQQEKGWQTIALHAINLMDGVYLINIKSATGIISKKVVVNG